MSATSHSSASLARVPLAYWLILTPALVAFAVTSGQVLFAGLLGVGALSCKLTADRLSASFPRFSMLPEWLLVAFAYAYALLPFWPGALSDHLWTPQITIAATAGFAASMRQRLGMGRPLASMAIVVLLLLARNVVAFFDFTVPLPDILRSIALVCIVEVARSRRHRMPNDDLSIEFGLALLLALFASFTLSSIALSVFLATLPIAGYLLRNHGVLRSPPDRPNRAQETIPRSRSLYDKQRRRALVASGFAFSFAALLIGCFAYLVLLKLPFWPNYTRDAPYFARSLASEATEISKATELDTQRLREYVRSTPDPEWLAGRRDAFRDSIASLIGKVQSFKPDRHADTSVPESEPLSPKRRNNPNLRPEQSSVAQTGLERSERQASARYSDRIDAPPSRSRLSEANAPATPDPSTSDRNHTLDTRIGSGPKEAKARPSISEISDSNSSYDHPASAKQLEELQQEAHLEQRNESVPDSSLQASPSPNLAQKIKQSLGLEEYLARYAQAESTLAEGLDLTPPPVASLLNQDPVLTVKLDSPQQGPERLYLRNNSLATLTKNGFVAGREDRLGTILLPEPNLNLDAFQTSSRGRHVVTITAQANRFATLPLPDSFSSIDFLGADALEAYPHDRVINAPQTSEALTYRMTGVDFDVTAPEPDPSHTANEYKERYLNVPLASPQKTYLKKLANRIGGRSQRSDRFADRVADYFARHHPYSFSADIPDGPEHPVIRWLKGKTPGLCTNYASAFTLLARSRGIPTRVATGYATSEYDAKLNRYTVRQRDAHAWIEYLDESGAWIRFDPTPAASVEELSRVARLVSNADPSILDRLVDEEKKNLAAMQSSELASSVDPDSEYADPFAAIGKNETRAEPTTSALEYGFPSDNPMDSSESMETSNKTAPTSVTASSRSEPDKSPPEIPQPLVPTPQPIEAPAASPTDSEQIPEKVTAAAAPLEPEKSPETIATSKVETSDDDANSSEASQQSLYIPWIVALVLLALLLPLARMTTRASASWTNPPETKLRAQAGQLLSKVERLTETHHLTTHPAWRDLRQALAAQRYGPQTDKLQLRMIADRLSMLVRGLSKTPSSSSLR